MKQADESRRALPDDLLQGVSDRLRKHGVVTRRVVVAVSGGLDSMLLLELICELSGELELTPLVGHVNHGLRGRDSDADAEWVEQIATARNLEFTCRRAHVKQLAERQGDGLEAAARQLRYASLGEMARDFDAGVILLAHTRDDQIETMLHHLLRGTGLTGLAGIPPAREIDQGIRVVRPLLGTSRQELAQTAARWKVPFRVDASNYDSRFTRNRIRHELIPHLKQQYQPQLERILGQLAEQVTETQSSLEQICRQKLLEAIEQRCADSCRLRNSVLIALPRHLQRECFRLLWTLQSWPRQRMGFREWNRLAESLETGQSWDLPDGLRIEHRGRLTHLFRPGR